MSTGAIAGLFPGQGSQTSKLREQVERVVPELLERCLALVGEDAFAKVEESTRFAQPAIFCASVAGWTQLRARLRPIALAGHSLGELSALVAAEALDPETGLELAVRRGELMAAAAADHDGGMLAVLGAHDRQIRALVDEHDVIVANDNAPGQTVLAGERECLRAASEQARGQKLRTIPLSVAGAFHSPAMSGAVEPFRAALDGVKLRTPRIPVISGSTARPFLDVPAELSRAIVKPVRWRETMFALASAGASSFVDFGPGHVLARLVRRNLPGARVLDDLTERSRASAEERSGVA
jgi:malonyl CoA-acyl carrier protein transacylase